MSGRTVSAAVVDQKGASFRVTSLQLNRDAREGELLVRIVASGVCHTDIAVRDGHIPTPFPVVLGHEGVGVVELVGPNTSGFESGDYVMVSYGSCGACTNCCVGKPSYCSTHRNNFATVERAWTEVNSGQEIHSHFFGQSSHATACIVVAKNAVKIDKKLLGEHGIPLKRLAPLGCGMQTGAGVIMNSLKPSAGSSIAIFGTGAVGLAAVMAAKAVGCTTIIGVDINEERLQLALELGCTSIVNSKGVDRESLIAQLHSKLPAGSAAGLDFSLDTTGRPDILRTAFEALRSTGVCALVGGSAPGSTCEIPMDKILLGRTLRGVIQGDAVSRVFLPQLLMLHVQGKFPFDRLITYYEGLEHVNQAAQDSLSGKTIKPVLVLSQP